MSLTSTISNTNSSPNTSSYSPIATTHEMANSSETKRKNFRKTVHPLAKSIAPVWRKKNYGLFLDNHPLVKKRNFRAIVDPVNEEMQPITSLQSLDSVKNSFPDIMMPTARKAESLMKRQEQLAILKPSCKKGVGRSSILPLR